VKFLCTKNAPGFLLTVKVPSHPFSFLPVGLNRASGESKPKINNK